MNLYALILNRACQLLFCSTYLLIMLSAAQAQSIKPGSMPPEEQSQQAEQLPLGQRQAEPLQAQPSQAKHDWLQQGSQQYQGGEYGAAIASWQQALTLAQQQQDIPKQGWILTSLGTAYLKQEEYQNAVQALEAFQSLPSHPQLAPLQAQALGNLGIGHWFRLVKC